MIEAAWIKDCADGVTEVWAKCGKCHATRSLMTNHRDPPEGQPFCTCIKCGSFLFPYEKREVLIDLVVEAGWPCAIPWLLAQTGAPDG